MDASFSERLFDCAQDTLFFIKNRDARYIAVNQALVDRCGAPNKAALLGCTAIDLFPAPFGTAYYEQDRVVLERGEEIRDCLQQVPGHDGSRGWTLSYKFPLKDRDGGIVGLCGICKDVREADPAQAGFPQIARAIDHIREHYAESLRIETLAGVAGIGTRRLERLIKRLFDLTPTQLLAKTRIEAAMRMLAQGKTSVAGIANACGYSDQSAFTRQFKQLIGTTPTHYRSSHADRPLRR
jgi:AraC-like DNA-binding protein